MHNKDINNCPICGSTPQYECGTVPISCYSIDIYCATCRLNLNRTVSVHGKSKEALKVDRDTLISIWNSISFIQ